MKHKAILLSCIFLLLVIILMSALPAKDDDNKTKLPPDLQAKVDDAVRKGTESVLNMCLNMGSFELTDHNKQKHTMRCDELMLYTLAHCGVPIGGNLETLLNKVLEAPLDKTYHVALQAMAREYIDKQKYQMRIADCAQYLVDNQCKNGQWSYGSEAPSDRWKKVISGDKPVGDAKVPDKKSTLTVKKGIRIVRSRPGPSAGDNSNMQYALLGLRACLETYIELPPETLQTAKKWITTSQNGDGGWGYAPNANPSPPYGSMTAGGLGSVAILSFYLKEGDANKKYIDKAMNWLTKNYNISANPFVPDGRRDYDYYYMYALERAGILAGIDKFGDHNWYEEGCKYLVGVQSENGLWNKNSMEDTCFALLFLRRATAPLKRVVTPGGGR
ncbi:MAG: terpene cyclase/mutase family protein [Planctomycetes bacterium]|nr:terpene cyclase/mutase family protein [Planctomycetota bacterium]